MMNNITKANTASKSFIKAILLGLSTLSLYPNVRYRISASTRASDIETKAWNMTGNSMRQAVEVVGKRMEIQHAAK